MSADQVYKMFKRAQKGLPASASPSGSTLLTFEQRTNLAREQLLEAAKDYGLFVFDCSHKEINEFIAGQYQTKLETLKDAARNWALYAPNEKLSDRRPGGSSPASCSPLL